MSIYISGGSGGSSTLSSQVLTASGSVNAWGTLVLVDTTTGSVTVTMPSAIGASKGQNVVIKKISNDNNVVIIDGYNTDTIESSTKNLYLYNNGDAITLCNMDGDSKIISDNRNSTGSTMSFLRVTNPTGQSTGLTANAPLMFNTIETIQGTGIAYNTSTYAFTLQPNRTYKLTAYIPKISLTSGGYFYARWWNDTTSSFVGAGMGGDAVTSSSSTMAGTTATYTITPSVVTTLRCCIKGLNSVVSLGDTDDALSAEVEEVSRQATVINSVDYAYGTIVSTLVGTTPSTVTATLSPTSGNLLVTSNTINLLSGKTYNIIVSARATNAINGATAVNASIYNVTNSTTLASGSLAPSTWSTNNDMANGTMICTITPSVNTQIQITGTNVGGNSPSMSGTYMVTQVGSTATTGVSSTLIDAQYQSFTPTITAVTTNPTFGTNTVYKCAYKQASKKSIKLIFNLIGSNNNGSIGSGTYKIQLPNNINMDTTLLQLATATNWYDATNLCSTYMTNGSGNNNYWCKVLPWSSTELVVYTQAGYWSSSIHATPASFSFVCEIPIV